MDAYQERAARPRLLAEVVLFIAVAFSLVAIERNVVAHAPSARQLILSATDGSNATTEVPAVHALVCRASIRVEGAEEALAEALPALGTAALAFIESWRPHLTRSGRHTNQRKR